MILFRARLRVDPSQRRMVIGSLRRMLDQTRALPGCTQCHILTDVDNGNDLWIVEDWSDMQALRSHLRSQQFKVILSALECTTEPPEVDFDVASSRLGMDFILACRSQGEVEV